MKTLSLISFLVTVSAIFLPVKAWAQQNPDTLAPMQFRQVITSKNFNHAGYSGDVLQLISGVVPGLSYTKKGSDPNVPATISVRGYTSEDEPSGVYCIIDGVYGADPRWLSPEDIESFEVITDAAATAAYGSRGRSGVIIIKTKSHQGDRKFGVNFATTISLNQPTKKLDVLSADEFRAIESVIDEGGSTDWQEAIFRNSVSQNYNLGFSGILNQTNYRISVFHRNNQGIVRGSGAKNTGIHLNLSQRALQNRLTLGTTLHFSQGKNEILPDYASANIRNNIFLNALYRNPTYPVRNPDGTYHELHYYNPVAILEYTNNESTTNNALMSINGQYQITKNIRIGFNTGFSNSKTERDFRQPFYYPTEVRYFDGMQQTKRFNWEAHLSFQKNINDHNFILCLKYLGIQENAQIDDEGTDEFTIVDRNRTITQLVPQIDYRYHNFFISALANAEFLKNEYNLDAAYSENGTYYHISYLKKDKLKGFFPAIRAGIDLSQEIGYFEKFMIFTGYGITGHISNEFLEGLGADVDMERTNEISAGINFELPGQRISGSLIYFVRNTKNQIRRIQRVIPPFTGILPDNDLKIRNSGIASSVSIIPVNTENIQWNTSICFFSNKSLLKSTKSGQDDIRTGYYYYYGSTIPVQVMKPGNAYPSFYMPEITGYDEYGNPTYKTNSYGRIFYIKGQPRPKIEMGWNNQLCIAEKLTVSLSLRYAGGYAIFNATKSILSDQTNLPFENINHDGLANYEAEHYSSPYDAKYLEDASFLRLENVTIGYTFKPKSDGASSSLTVFIGADNLFTWTNYDGYDPAGYSDGIDAFNVYPLARTYNFGLRMNL